VAEVHDTDNGYEDKDAVALGACLCTGDWWWYNVLYCTSGVGDSM
jgi:hypothetical protein